MTKDEKELLLKDLCVRLPYGVKVELTHWRNRDKGIMDSKVYPFPLNIDKANVLIKTTTDVKPYLFPISSMTDEMLEELNANGFFKYRDTIANVSHLESNGRISEEIYTYIDIENISFLIAFFHSHHIDYRGLIEKGLAIDATNKNIY